MWFGLDPTWWLIAGPAFLLAMWAEMKVKRNFAKYSRVEAASGLTGAQAAYAMLRRAGVDNVGVERHKGFLSDHYDPRSRALRLSPDVHDGRSLAALGVACHEAGHAIQHAGGYVPLQLRNAIVPVASFGSWAAIPMIFIGAILGITGLAKLGIIVFAALVVFQLINLPVEFNASSRAKTMLRQTGMISGSGEARAVASVLNAAAMTYVAATVQAVATLLYFVMLFSDAE